MRRAARKDANHNAIAAELVARGYSVADTSQIGNGFPDIVVGGVNCWGEAVNWLFEIKDPDKPLSARKLTDKEADFLTNWRGLYAVILTADEAIALLEA